MDRQRLQQHLDEAEEHVAQAEQHVAQQQALVARLERVGLPTATARRVLALLEESRDLHIIDRDRLRHKLAQYPVTPKVPIVEWSPAPENGTPDQGHADGGSPSC
jgi:hypothetical protein